MSEGVLSQEEIDALLHSDGFSADVEPEGSKSVGSESHIESAEEADQGLNFMEKDALGEVANIVMGSAATALSTLLGRKVEITTPVVEITDPESFRHDYPLPYLLVNVEYIEGLSGSHVLIIREGDAGVMVDLIMGGDGQSPPPALEEMHLSAVSEAMNQMMGAAATAMSTMINERVDITPPVVDMVNFATEGLKGSVGVKDQILVKISFRMTIEGLVDSEMLQLIPLDLAKNMVKNLMDEMNSANPVEEVADMTMSDLDDILNEQGPVFDRPAQVAAAVESIPVQSPEPQVFATPPPATRAPVQPAAAVSSVPVQPVQFAPLQPNYQPKEIGNMDLIMDVPLQITVELGKSRKTIREILNLGPGSVVELDKLAGEPVDLLVNGKLLAKGEVVVIDENFGIRITDIISPIERVSNLQ